MLRTIRASHDRGSSLTLGVFAMRTPQRPSRNQIREVFLISKLGSECRRTNFGPVKAMPRNQGRDSMPWNQCGHPEEEIGASASDILGIRECGFSKIDSMAFILGVRESRFTKIAAKDFPDSQAAFDPLFPVPYNQPNKALEPTITSVTDRAAHDPRQP